MIYVANLLSRDLDELAGAIAAVLQSSLGLKAAAAPGAAMADFRGGDAGIAHVCGLCYTLLHDADPRRFTPVAAPVIDEPRSGDASVYFSDIVVPRESRAAGLDDLEGARFAYNEEISFSGYRALEHALRTRGLSWALFRERVRSGSHRESLARIADGAADAAAIDSHVLVLEQRRDPALAGRIKVIEGLGPYPAPPVAINTGGCAVTADQLRAALERLPADTLQRAAIRRWRPVDDAYYDALREATAGLPDLAID